MPDTDKPALIHWHQVVDNGPLDTPEKMLTYYAAGAKAYIDAYEPWKTSDPAEIRRQTYVFLYPYLAMFTAAAFAAGWSIEQINDATEDGASASEWVWQWLTEAGVDPNTIAPMDHALYATAPKEPDRASEDGAAASDDTVSAVQALAGDVRSAAEELSAHAADTAMHELLGRLHAMGPALAWGLIQEHARKGAAS